MAPGVKDFVTTMMTAMQKHYPEFTRKVIVIQAPMAFNAIWAGIKLGLPQRILAKVEVIGGDVKQALLHETTDMDIPSFYGGKAATGLDSVSSWEALPMASVAAGGNHRVQVSVPVGGSVVTWDIDPIDGALQCDFDFYPHKDPTQGHPAATPVAKYPDQSYRAMGEYISPGRGTFIITLSNPTGWLAKRVRHSLSVGGPNGEAASLLTPESLPRPDMIQYDPSSTRSDGSVGSFESYGDRESFEDRFASCPNSPLLAEIRVHSPDELYLPGAQVSESPIGGSLSLSLAGHSMGDAENLPLCDRLAVAWSILMKCIIGILTVPCMVCCPGVTFPGVKWLKERIKRQDGAGAFLQRQNIMRSD
jgi:hypothetical protein